MFVHVRLLCLWRRLFVFQSSPFFHKFEAIYLRSNFSESCNQAMQSNYLFDWANWLKCVARRDYPSLSLLLNIWGRDAHEAVGITNTLYVKVRVAQHGVTHWFCEAGRDFVMPFTLWPVARTTLSTSQQVKMNFCWLIQVLIFCRRNHFSYPY